ncbi:uncharacterized protein LOC123668879 [Melitaea cinxia]|uniref:uncharacterized protein LOC123668879 n=1 Tax=Melitaea cinxia TaxID=113334 RepID=UPI001E271416|nr:uncharacterized protein LOC123668879 [Melitaea cinxia]
MIKETMLMNQDAKGFILVGFPKNHRMSNIFNRQVKWPEKIVALEVDNEVATTRLQNKLSELGRPESEINAAKQIVKEAAHKVKNVHKRFGSHVVTLDSSGNPKILASTLKEILSDTIEKSKKSEAKLSSPASAPTFVPNSPTANTPSANVPTADAPTPNIPIQSEVTVEAI